MVTAGARGLGDLVWLSYGADVAWCLGGVRHHRFGAPTLDGEAAHRIAGAERGPALVHALVGAGPAVEKRASAIIRHVLASRPTTTVVCDSAWQKNWVQEGMRARSLIS